MLSCVHSFAVDIIYKNSSVSFVLVRERAISLGG